MHRLAIITIASLCPALISSLSAEPPDLSKAPSHRRVAFLRAGLEFTAITAEAHRLADAAANGGSLDAKKACEVMDHRWQMMRAILQHHPLAVNVGVVAGNSSALNSALGWKGPDDAAKSGGLQLPTDDNWLNEDQSATRIHHEATRCARAKKRLHF